MNNKFHTLYIYMHTITELIQKINTAVEDIQYNTEPKKLYDPIRYILSIGGKRKGGAYEPRHILRGYAAFQRYGRTDMPGAGMMGA